MIESVRDQIGAAIFARVAGPDGPERRERIHGKPGERRFTPDDPIWRVHKDGSMFVGGIRALLLQSLHPGAMAGVANHSRYKEDPWGRLQQTSNFIAETTFATIEDSDRLIRIVRAHHSRVKGTTADGLEYDANDPDTLAWVHCAEIDSFLRAHDRFSAHPLSRSERDLYVAQTAHAARGLGAARVPETVAELDARLAEFRPLLRSTPDARETARWIVWRPPVPIHILPAYTVLVAGAVSLMPWWTRTALRLPLLPVSEATGVRAATTLLTRTMGWAMARQ